jgi:hypothetical protein
MLIDIQLAVLITLRDAARPNLGRPKKKGAGLCGGTARSATGSLVCGGEPVVRSYHLPREEQ